jgi:regulator of sigma E protease
MIVLNILIGLVGLGIVVFVHELGHLIAAKAVGIEVEAFSLGWGRKLAGYTWRGTEYRISVFPVGGYCKMKGEQSYATALENNEDRIPEEPGSFFSAAPWKRIVTLLAGPVANLMLAMLILTVIWWIGFSTQTFENRVVLAAEYQESPVGSQPSPAERAGLQSGDYIVTLGDREVETYTDIQETVAQNARTELDLIIQRNGSRIATTITPALEPETGSGRIGVFAWVDPVIAQVEAGSPADLAGLRAGDQIVAIAGSDTPHSIAVGEALSAATPPAQLSYRRNGSVLQTSVQPRENGMIGVAFQTITIETPELSLIQAVGRGVEESFRILTLNVRSLRLLFQGVQLRSAVAGPVRISYFIGDVTTSGFAVGIGEGLRSLFNFLALLSVVLFFMNLLPIPVLDGGQIVLSTIEWVRGRAAHPRTVQRYQTVGAVIIFALLFFAIFGDILFIAGR